MRGKPDHYSQKARKEGYPARSVYKLQELDEKMRLLPRHGAVLDVGAAPGSWSMYVQRRGRGRLKLVAVDLKPMADSISLESALILEGDVFDESLQVQIAEQAPFALIMSDAAPATIGNRTVDCGRSFSLVEGILGLAPRFLAPGGNFIAKVFQGGQERLLLRRIQQEFRTGRMLKPKACRSESFETFLIGIDYGGNT